MSQLDVGSSVADWILERPQLRRVFEQMGIDYCCGGQRSLGESCTEAGLDPTSVVQTLTAMAALEGGPSTETRDWRQASLTELCDHIEQTHHQYVRTEMERVATLLDKVARVHGSNHPELQEVKRHFAAQCDELLSHLPKEEQILFPAIRQLEAGTSDRTRPPFGSLANPIRAMEAEHDSAGQAMGAIHRLTHDYQPPADACNSYRAMLEALKEWEEDLHQHIHKENNILFPGALALERSRH